MKTLCAIVMLALSATAAYADTAQAMEAKRILANISDSLLSGRANKPITRSALSPRRQDADLRFVRQSDLTSDLVDRYLNRGISHFLPWDKPERSRVFLYNTGTKYIHWSHLLWGQAPPDWKLLCAEIDAVHGSDWGKDVVYEAGVMECVYRTQIDNARIPDWLYQCMEDLGLNKTRKPGPNGPRFFSYDNLFDRTAEDWPKDFIGRWDRGKDGVDTGSVPDLTMVETQLWYAYLMVEYIDAGFEGIFFGQYGLTGVRDTGCECLWEITQFARRLAAARGYRHAVFLSTHHYCIAYKGQLAPDSPTIFTHMTWPSRMFYSDRFAFGMETGLNATEDGQHRARAEFANVIKKPPFDLPVLIEIDNYGPMPPGSPIACNSDGDDEITAYNKKPSSDRAAFLRYYYHEFRTYVNKRGKRRTHFAPSGERMIYKPYKENGGEEQTIKELFAQAAAESRRAVFSGMPGAEWVSHVDKARNFAMLYPSTMQPKNRSAEMRPKSPGAFWVAFSYGAKKPVYVANVRCTTLAATTLPDDYAKYNTYLRKWDRVEINSISGFRTTTGTRSAKNVIHRALFVNDKSAWMLNFTDSSGGDPQVTKRIFDHMLWSLNILGQTPL